MAQTIVKVEGMSCNGCRGKVEKALQGIPGVTDVSVDLGTKEAIITGFASHAEYVKVIEDLGFTVID
ncbi:Copper-exporting P-type ATPase [Sporomusa silvacetica DSM 10669]|uniref:Copper-exporting P-type ATPase n=1 Tax=Sporomusa silvacetica DSM 10669 TaxID=1123289 RepID=A0ABZ3IH68_9FIRM|nr:heavy metal-associated domain-containing protein [Sporomusa silvacetica]OZC14855.1 copper-exporting P-type ATPase A [Sporomusa silvacetica DSM 10669]